MVKRSFIVLLSCLQLAMIHGQNLSVWMDSVSNFTGSQVNVSIRIKNAPDLLSMQGTIAFDTGVVSFDTVNQFGLPGMNVSGFGLGAVNNGRMTFSWDDASLNGVAVADSTVLFAMRFNLIGTPGDSGQVWFSDNPTILEFVDSQFNVMTFDSSGGLVSVLDTLTNVLKEKENKVELHIAGNPLNTRSMLIVVSEKDKVGVLKLIQVDGKPVMEQKLKLNRGENIFPINEWIKESHVASGIYHFQLSGNDILLSTKLIVLENE